MNPNVETWVERLVWVPATVLLMAGFAMFVMLMDDEPPGKFVPGSQSVAVEEDRIVLSYAWIRPRTCDAVFTRSIIDPAGKLEHLTPMFYTAELVAAIQAANKNRVTLVLPKPAKPIPGVYRMQGLVQYSCNFAQEIWPIKVSFTVPYRLIAE